MQNTLADPASVYREAMLAKDIDALTAVMAPDVVLHSPITLRKRFQGREEVRELLSVVLEVIDDVHYDEEIPMEGGRVFIVRSLFGGHPSEDVVVLRFDETGERIREFRLYIRPLGGVAAAAAAIGPRLGARRGRVRALALTALLRPLAFIIRRGDPLAMRLIG